MKIHEPLNIVFKCNYCNGGKSEQQVGFNSICSEYMIHQNMIKTWCSSPNCQCSHYFNKSITYQNLLEKFKNGEFICYESTMLKNWQASAGRTRKEHKPKKFKQIGKNKLCVLTTREPGYDESARYIFAVFLIDDFFNGDEQKEGYVKNNSQWKLSLKPQEAYKMRFWNYYSNNDKNQNEDWRSGLYRYFSDEQAVQILKDIVEITTEKNEKEFAQKFLEHY